MATYRTFDELNGKTLEQGDTVIIGGVSHQVFRKHLSCIGDSNDIVMVQRGIDPVKLMEDAYGYPIDRGIWPESEPYDYEALTRGVLVLMAFYEDSDVEVKMQDGTWKIFRRKDYLGILPESREMEIGSYIGTITQDTIKVGCQNIPFSTVEQVYNTMKELRKKK